MPNFAGYTSHQLSKQPTRGLRIIGLASTSSVTLLPLTLALLAVVMASVVESIVIRWQVQLRLVSETRTCLHLHDLKITIKIH